MEKLYSVKDIDVLYHDGKIIPVVLENKNGKTFANEILSKNSYELNKQVFGLETFNKSAQYIVSLSTNSEIKSYGEIGSLANCICLYGKNSDSKNSTLSKILCMFKNFKNTEDKELVENYFKIDLKKSEIKELFENMQNQYKKETEGLIR